MIVAIFFTFALLRPPPPKEMSIILGITVLLDAMLIRLVLIPVALRLLGDPPGPSRARSTTSCPTSPNSAN